MYFKLTDADGRPINLVATGAANVTPDDDNDLSGGATSGLFVGVAGDVAVVMKDGSEVVFKDLMAGVKHDLSVIRVKNTGTTASNIVAVY